MLQIDDRPLTDACATCNQPLDWVWRHRDQRWYAIVRYPEVEDPTVVKLHTCPLIGVPRLWRNLQYQPAGVRSRGARKVRAVLATTKTKRRTEERPMSRPERRCDCPLVLQGGEWIKTHTAECAYYEGIPVALRGTDG